MYNFKYNALRIQGKELYSEGEFNVENNGIYLLIGKNGVGKSTLLKQLFYNNKERCIYIAQDNNEIFEDVSVLENIIMFQQNYNEEMITNIFAELEIIHLLQRKAINLSGGEKRLVILLRGILSEANLLFIDEPTNDLHYKIVEKIVKILKRYQSEKVIFIVTHDERLFEISDAIYKIEERKVKLVEKKDNSLRVNSIAEEQKAVREYSAYFNKNINRILKRDYTELIIIILFFFCSLYLMYTSYIGNKGYISNVNSNQINIANSLYASPDKLIEAGFIPTRLISSIYEGKSISALKKEVEILVEDLKNQSSSQEINTNFGGKYKVYEIGFVDVLTNEKFNILDQSLRFMNVTEGDALIDTNNYFAFDYSLVRELDTEKRSKTIEFNLKAYNQALEELRQNNYLINSYVTVLLNEGEDFDSFVQSDEFEKMKEGTYFIQSADTIKLVQEVYAYSKCKENIKLITILTAIVILIMFSNIYLNIIKVRRTRIIFRNYGLDLEIINKVIEKDNTRFIIAICGVLFFINIVIAKVTVKLHIMMNYIFLLIFIGTLLIMNLLKKRINKSEIKNISTFGGVFDED